jgi:glutathione S-transferase
MLICSTYSEVKAWVQKIRSRKAVEKGLHEPLGHWDFETKMRGGEEGFSKEHSDWIMKGQNADQEKFK